jgi:hypothetical protein
VVLFSRSDEGHRRAYVDFAARLLNGERRPVHALPGARLPVLFLMIEEAFCLYVAVSLIRAALGRRTVGLLFRPQPAVEGKSVRLRLKRLALKLLRRVPGCRTLTILPFELDPRFGLIAHDCIDDFQLWDLGILEREAAAQRRIAACGDGGLGDRILQVAGGRLVVCALGRQDRSKGFDVFTQSYSADAGLREGFLFAYGGKVAGGLDEEVRAFSEAGGFAEAREVSDEELLELYRVADLVWICYAPDYDQASGIFGRAVQLGIPAAVRSGSLIHRLCAREGIAHVAIAGGAGTTLGMTVPGVDGDAGAAHARRFAARSLPRLWDALGLVPCEAETA